MISENKFESIFNLYFDGKLNFSDMLSLNKEKELKHLTIENREVIKCSEKLKKIHHFLNLFIFDNLSIQSDVVFSYRKNVNVVDAVVPHAQNKFIFKTDLNNFFKSIKRSEIYNNLISQTDQIPIIDIVDYIDLICDLVTYHDELPLGFSTSPNISNAIFNQYDIKIKEYCLSKKITYTRYADDILLSSDNYIDKNEYIELLNNILTIDGKRIFSLNSKKTKLIKKSKNMEIMGVKILPDGKITVSKKIKNQVETKLYLFIKNQSDFIKYTKSNKISSINKLSGQLNYINTIDPEYIEKLKSKYGNSLVELFFRKAI
ncbi:reverse transcriptase domain-containing protein [Enterobacter bugandensis]|nr:RNA-directed DNA polymerase [Enterobacter bugandensis]